MDVVKKRIADLRPVDKNVRRHPALQIKELQRSYQMFGQYRPLVVTHDGVILVGNGLFTALRELDVEEIDCIVLPEKTPESYKQKLMLADNKTFELGANDVMNIDELIKGLDDFVIPGFDEDTLKELYAESEQAVQAINNMFVVPEEKKESINRVVEQRATEPPQPLVAKPSTFEATPTTQAEPPMVEKTEVSGSYITCPHCGMKIWGL